MNTPDETRIEIGRALLEEFATRTGRTSALKIEPETVLFAALVCLRHAAAD